MPGEVKLKPCPFCGGETNVNAKYSSVFGCVKCGAMFNKGREHFIKSWNRRTPEPGTSVIRWTRYDGTPETLPDDCRYVIAQLKRADYVWAGETDMPFHIPDFRVGDLWSYLPEPQEGMK